MDKLIEKIFLLKRRFKILVQLLVDSFLIFNIFFLSMYLRLDNLSFIERHDVWITILITIPITLMTFYKLGFYQNIIRYITNEVIITVFYGVFISSWFILFLSQVFSLEIPRSVPIIYFTFMIIFISGIRFTVSLLYKYWKSDKPKLVAIYGAGSTGRQLLNYLKDNNEFRPIIFFDDKDAFNNKNIMGINVKKFENSQNFISKYNLDAILLAMPKLSIEKKQEIIGKINKYNIEIKSIPNISEMMSGSTNQIELRNITIEEILERETVPAIKKLLKPNIFDKNVLVTGAGGSIGSELCRQILKIKPNHLIILDKSEFNLYKINEELQKYIIKHNLFVKITPLLLSIQESKRIFNLLKKLNVHTIYHSAAYKHVPLIEKNIIGGIQNNIIGTKVLVNSAIKLKIENFILISTDKAVRPTNYMGATKRVAEMLCQSSAKLNLKTKFSIVRFGNVMGSSGSVIPLFKEQIKNGGPITVTHRSISRYFMTIKEASQLVIQAGAISSSGQIFVLDMGNPIKIFELAKRMCFLHGLKPYVGKNKGDIEIKIVGLRIGEKLHEELSKSGKYYNTLHPRIKLVSESTKTRNEIDKIINIIEDACIKNDLNKIKINLIKLDNDFKLSEEFHEINSL